MSDFSPRRERVRREGLIARVARASMRAPAWVLCPGDGLRHALEAALAQAGGGFARFVEVGEFAQALEARLGLPFARSPTEHERADAMERCLAARDITVTGEASAGSFQTALALLPVIDSLRAHRWDGRAVSGVTPTLPPEAAALVEAHVELLGDLLQELEVWTLASGALDTTARLRRLRHAITNSDLRFEGFIALDGFDRVSPVERDVLLALRARGAEVDVAPWVAGWPSRSTERVDEVRDEAVGWLEALETGAARCHRDDGSVALAIAGDPMEEAELVALWIAERCARGCSPDEHAVRVDGGAGAIDRVRRALVRYGVPCQGAGVMPVRETVAWQVFRASVSLGWTGVDVIDLLTVLSAPGSGVWGAERDRLCAALRRELPGDWHAVRALLAKLAAPADAGGEATPEDAARQVRRVETCARVEELVTLWSTHGPLRRHPPTMRFEALRALVVATLSRFMDSVRLADAIDDPRTQALWIESTARIQDAARATLTRWQRLDASVPAEAPGHWLAQVEAVLGSLSESVTERSDGVRIVSDDQLPRARPRVLVVTGFHRGRYPAPVARPLLLGPLERAWLSGVSPELASLPDERDLAEDASRAVSRALTVASERVLLVAPRRAVDGSEVAVALAWRDLLALLPEAHCARYERAPPPTLRAYIERELPAERATGRGALDLSLRALSKGDVPGAVAALGSSARRSTRDLLAARFVPDRSYKLGDIVRARLAETEFTVESLETLLSCRYAFLTGTLLGLHPLRLARAPTLATGDRARVARAALLHLDTHPDAPPRTALDAAIAAELPWAASASDPMAVMELRRAVERFLHRYADMKRAMGFGGARPQREEAVVIPLPGGRVKSMRVRPTQMRVEGGEGGRSVLIDLRSGSTRSLRAQRESGLDVASALASLLADRADEPGVTAMMRVSVSRVERERVPRAPRGGDGDEVSLDEHRDRVLSRVADTLDALMSDGAGYPPLDEPAARALEAVGALPCGRCPMALACRFRVGRPSS